MAGGKSSPVLFELINSGKGPRPNPGTAALGVARGEENAPTGGASAAESAARGGVSGIAGEAVGSTATGRTSAPIARPLQAPARRGGPASTAQPGDEREARLEPAGWLGGGWFGGGAGENWLDLNRVVAVRMSVVLIAAGCVAVGMFLVYSLGFVIGSSQAEAKAARDLGDAGYRGVPVNPGLLKDQGSIVSLGRGAAGPDAGRPTEPQPGPRQAQTTEKARPEAAPTPRPAAGDPRTPGLNYLVIAGQLEPDDAERMVAFFAANGVEAFVERRAVDPSGAPAKNPGLVRVLSVKGLTRNEYRDRAPARTELEAQMARLGQVWKRDYKGRTDFSQTTWEKYVPAEGR